MNCSSGNISTYADRKRFWNMRKLLTTSLLLLTVALLSSAAEPGRTWTSQNGRKIDATLIRLSEGSVTVRRDDGQVFTFPINRLGQSDQDYVLSLQTDKGNSHSSSNDIKINEMSNGSDSLSNYEDLAKLAKQARKKAGVSALGICIIRDFKTYGIGYSSNGQSKLEDKAKQNDQISIASCTKSMNATLAAIVVSKGEINWNTTLEDVFPELSADMNKRYRSVSLEQLLSHSAGVPGMNAFWKSKEYAHAVQFEGTPREQRYELLRIVTEQRPIFRPGTDFEYSNAGHYIAGSMIERVMDQTWESLMEDLVLKPLKMRNTTPLRIENSQLTAPGGGIRSTMEDFAKFCIFHMQFNVDNVLGIKRKDFEKMHEASDNADYGLGFFVISREWAKGDILQHTGRNGQCASTFYLAQREGFGIFVIAPGWHSDSHFWNDTINFILDDVL